MQLRTLIGRRLRAGWRFGAATLAAWAIAVAATVAPVAAPAGARDEAIVAEPVRISGESPYPPGCEGVEAIGANYRGTAVEPHLAINPGDPNHLVGAWQQDRWSTGGASGQRTVVSFDRGRTWVETEAPFSNCTGGSPADGTDLQRLSDPWIAIAPNGDVHQAALGVSLDDDGSLGPNAILVSRSADGGLTWQPARTLMHDTAAPPVGTGFNDKETLTADPFDANYLYAVWDRDQAIASESVGDDNLNDSIAPPLLSRSRDGGRTWELPRVIFDATSTIANQIVVLPNGDLVNALIVFPDELGSGGVPVFQVAAMRSDNRGESWSLPEIVETVRLTSQRDPVSGRAIRPPFMLDVAADPVSGAVYLAWPDPGPARTGRTIRVAHSFDGGRSWSAPVPVSRPAEVSVAFTPKVHVRADGVVGVTYYGVRAARPAGDPTIPTDYRLAYCRAACHAAEAWAETIVAGPFDLARAPAIGGATTPGLFVGDYNGLVSDGAVFLTLFALGPRGPDDPASAVYFTTVTIPAD